MTTNTRKFLTMAKMCAVSRLEHQSSTLYLFPRLYGTLVRFTGCPGRVFSIKFRQCVFEYNKSVANSTGKTMHLQKQIWNHGLSAIPKIGPKISAIPKIGPKMFAVAVNQRKSKTHEQQLQLKQTSDATSWLRLWHYRASVFYSGKGTLDVASRVARNEGKNCRCRPSQGS